MIRFKPSILVDVLSAVSDDEKSWISSTGFGSVLSFQSKEYPVEISALLLWLFEPKQGEEEDIREIMGFP